MLAVGMPLTYPTINEVLNLAAFPMLFHFPAISYIADPPVSLRQGMLEETGRFQQELGGTWISTP